MLETFKLVLDKRCNVGAIFMNLSKAFPVDTRRRFNVYTTSLTSYKRRIDVETTSCVYWVDTLNHKGLLVKLTFYGVSKKAIKKNNIVKKAVAQRCSLKKLLLGISQNSQENTCTRVSFLIKFQA